MAVNWSTSQNSQLAKLRAEGRLAATSLASRTARDHQRSLVGKVVARRFRNCRPDADGWASYVGLPGRDGDADDLELIASVEAALGRSRTEDVAFGLEVGNQLDVVEKDGRRGWVLWQPGRLFMLGATDEETAATLFWRYIGQSGDNVVVFGLTTAQNWAFDVAHQARLSLRVDGAMFVAGMAIPGLWMPSGWFF